MEKLGLLRAVRFLLVVVVIAALGMAFGMLLFAGFKLNTNLFGILAKMVGMAGVSAAILWAFNRWIVRDNDRLEAGYDNGAGRTHVSR